MSRKWIARAAIAVCFVVGVGGAWQFREGEHMNGLIVSIAGFAGLVAIERWRDM